MNNRIPSFSEPMSAYVWFTEFFPSLVQEEPRRLVMRLMRVLEREPFLSMYLSERWTKPECGTTYCIAGWLHETTKEGQSAGLDVLPLWYDVLHMPQNSDYMEGPFYYRWRDKNQGSRAFADDVIRNTREWAKKHKAHLETVMLHPRVR